MSTPAENSGKTNMKKWLRFTLKGGIFLAAIETSAIIASFLFYRKFTNDPGKRKIKKKKKNRFPNY